MKRALIISYNLVRPNENPIPLSVASIITYAKADPEYGIAFEIDQLQINLLEEKGKKRDSGLLSPSLFIYKPLSANKLNQQCNSKNQAKNQYDSKN